MKYDEILKKELKIHCKKAINSGVHLYRGSSRPEGMHVMTIRDDRRALHSTRLSVSIFNFCMTQWDKPYRKSNTVSVTTDTTQATDYGNLFRVYPYDDIKFLASKKFTDFINFPKTIFARLSDLGIFSFEERMRITRELKDADSFDHEIFDKIKQLNLKFNDYFFEVNNINALGLIEGEVLMYGSKYIMVNETNDNGAKD